MYCQKCGAELPDYAMFCAKCGTNQTSFKQSGMAESTQMSGNALNQEAIMDVGNKALNSVKKIKPKYFVLAGVVIVAIIVGIFAIKMIGSVVDFNDYVIVSFEGYNTRGTVKYDFDVDAFAVKYRDILKKNGITKRDTNKLNELLGKIAKEDIDKTSELSNGDEVILEWDIDEEDLKDYLGLRSKTANKTYVVEGLKEMKMFDPFDEVEISYSGVDGQGCASIENVPDNGLNYYIENPYGLSEGDIIKAHAECYDIDSYIEQYGTMPSNEIKEYTIGKLDSYIIKDEEVTEEFMNRVFAVGEPTAEDNMVKFCSYWEDLYNLINDDDILWAKSGRVTGEILPVKLIVGNRRTDNTQNCIYAVYNVPYEAYIKNDARGKQTGEVIGRGYCYIVVKFNNAVIMQNDFAVGNIDSSSTSGYLSEKAVDAAIELERDKFDFKEYPAPGYTDPN